MAEAPLCVTFRMTIDDYRAGVRRLAWALWPIRLIVVVTIAAAIAGLTGALLPNRILAIVGVVVFVTTPCCWPPSSTSGRGRPFAGAPT